MFLKTQQSSGVYGMVTYVLLYVFSYMAVSEFWEKNKQNKNKQTNKKQSLKSYCSEIQSRFIPAGHIQHTILS